MVPPRKRPPRVAHSRSSRTGSLLSGLRSPRSLRLRSLPGVDLELVALIVEHSGRAIDFFVGALGFELVEDSPSLTNDGRPKRWVVVRPPGARTGLLLAQADGD